ncbi:MAG TPA: amidohydrolase family protein [Fimbriimonadaceae bacterium]|nr:amidohydrolase family protein [Fimbriimonadaceae bacterium]
MTVASEGIIDCDVHPYFNNGIADLATYLSDAWRHRLGLGQLRSDGVTISMPSWSIPANTIYINDTASFRKDATPPDGSVPGSDPAFVQSHLLDEYGIERAILIGGNVLGLGAMADPDVAAVLASAYNDWLIERWLAEDSRFRGALVIAPQDPDLAVKEINRVGDAAGMVEILIPLIDIAMGTRHFYPIYEAAQEHDLAVTVHPAGTENIFFQAPPMAVKPAYKVEWRTALTQVHQSNLISLLCHGVFERFPRLRFVITEGGFAWLPDVIWRLDSSWRALRDEIPWVKQLPSEYIRTNVRFTSQPFVEAPRPEQTRAICELVDAETTVIFSSDYPHFDFDDPNRALNALDQALRQRILSTNAREFFGERLVN